MQAPPRTATIPKSSLNGAAMRERVVAETAMKLFDKNLIDRRGKPLPVVIAKIADALGIPVRALQDAHFRLEEHRETSAQMMSDAGLALAVTD